MLMFDWVSGFGPANVALLGPARDFGVGRSDDRSREVETDFPSASSLSLRDRWT